MEELYDLVNTLKPDYVKLKYCPKFKEQNEYEIDIKKLTKKKFGKILDTYETEIFGETFKYMQNYIDHITQQEVVINYFFPPQHPQRGGNNAALTCRRIRTLGKLLSTRGFVRLATMPTEPLPTEPLPDCVKKAKQIFIEHIICGYPSPPPDWVYDTLDEWEKTLIKKK